MKFKSSLWLETSQKSRIDSKVIENLNLKSVYDRLINNDEILYYLCKDKDTIRFRQEIIEDFINQDGLLESLYKALEQFYNLKPMYRKHQYKKSNLYRIIDLIIVMEMATKSMEALSQIFRDYSVTSRGLQDLKESVEENIRDSEFKEMKQDLRDIKYLFRQIRSATLTVQMTKGLRPQLAQVTQVDNHKYRYPKAFRHVSDVLTSDTMFLGQGIASYVPVFHVGRLNYNLLEEIEYALKDHRQQLVDFLAKYDHMDIQPFLRLYNEMSFYESSYRLYEQLNKKNLPVCVPTVHEKEWYLKFEDGYNVNLALEADLEDDEIILNDFDLHNERQSFLLTGANRGGKTTFTQCIGQIQILGQLGLFVPAKKADIFLSEGVLCHFPVSEKESVEKGKFGRECEMFVEAFRQASPKKLYLLNESFSGTSHLESLSVATQAVLAMYRKDIPFVFNTHLHELYEEVLGQMEGKEKSKLISLTTEIDNRQSTYRMIEAHPIGKSFAKEIAAKYGVTYEQLTGGESN